MGKVQFQVDGLDSNTASIFNADATFDGNVDANSISIAGNPISNVYATQSHVANVYAPKSNPAFTGNTSVTGGWLALMGQDTKLLFNDYYNPLFLEHSIDYNKLAIRNYGDANAVNLATEAYVSNAISNVSIDLSTAAGIGIDWNANTSQYDIANTIATLSYVDLIQYGSEIAGTSHTLESSDLGKLIETTSSSAVTVTIPSDPSDSTFPIGSSVEFRQMGTGRITFSPTSPATMVSTESYTKTRIQYSSIVLEKRANNAWILTGDIDA